MMRRLSTRAWVVLMIALGLVGAGLRLWVAYYAAKARARVAQQAQQPQVPADGS